MRKFLVTFLMSIAGAGFALSPIPNDFKIEVLSVQKIGARALQVEYKITNTLDVPICAPENQLGHFSALGALYITNTENDIVSHFARLELSDDAPKAASKVIRIEPRGSKQWVLAFSYEPSDVILAEEVRQTDPSVVGIPDGYGTKGIANPYSVQSEGQLSISRRWQLFDCSNHQEFIEARKFTVPEWEAFNERMENRAYTSQTYWKGHWGQLLPELRLE